ncbi:MAG TPA: protocatechuate 3,4-dioxygenase subunit beta [Candidatus Binataceae bacterium]|nr:protocatechuate 3,4-dioxygenase subunit beta [Candidatus Binataceae bacterium]
MTATQNSYRQTDSDVHPSNASPDYESTCKRAPSLAPISIAQTLSEITGPRFDESIFRPGDGDLTRFAGGVACGERIIIGGRVLDEDGRPVPGIVIEIWQANAAGRYAHDADRHDAPLDPHFSGVGRVFTGADGAYRFVTIRPGAYPWRNHYNGWRPAHIHYSLLGPAFATRLITQMYFEGDPLLALDPIFNAVPEIARDRLIAVFYTGLTVPEFALGYRFDFVLRGRDTTFVKA